MLRRSLQVCIAAAGLAHGALIWAFVHAKASGNPGDHPAPGRMVALVRVVAAAPPPQAVAPVAPAPAPAPARGLTPVPTPVPASAPGAAPDRFAGASTASGPELSSIAPRVEYRAPSELDRPALPRSAPDTAFLVDQPWSGVPMRLRLFIDAKGVVADVVVLDSADPPTVVEHVRQMFLATTFQPGTARGIDVPSYKDIEVVVGAPR